MTTKRRQATLDDSEHVEVVSPQDSTALAPTGGGEIGDLLRAAIDKDVTVESMEKLVGLYERMEDRNAVKAFNAAFKVFRAECPEIRKTQVVQAGSFAYTFAPLDEIDRVVRPHLEAHGFSYWWDSDTNGGEITVTCKLEHEAGHSKESHFTCPFTSKAGMSDQQKHASALTYGKRQSLTSVLGLSTTDADTDGGAPLSRIDESQAALLDELIRDSKADRAKFLKHAKVDKVEDILQESYGALVKALEEKKRRG